MKTISMAEPKSDKRTVGAVAKVLLSGQLAQGRLVARLEKKAAEMVKAKHCLAVSSGTAGLHTALAALDLNPGDEVITTPFTFIATINCIMAVGARPILVDINPDTFNLDPQMIAKVLSPKTKAILPVSLFGLSYDYGSVAKIVEGRAIKIIEDACQSFGAKYRNKYSGMLGDIGVTSLYATKIITSGEGGLLFTDDDQLAEKMARFRHHGQVGAYEYESFGLNYRMTDILAAAAFEELKRLDYYVEKRKANALLYNKMLKGLPGLKLPEVLPKDAKPNYSLYTIRVGDGLGRNDLYHYLKRQGVNGGIYYPKPLHLVGFLSKKLGYRSGDFPQAEKASLEVLSLPSHPRLSTADIVYVSNLIRKYVQEKN